MVSNGWHSRHLCVREGLVAGAAASFTERQEGQYSRGTNSTVMHCQPAPSQFLEKPKRLDKTRGNEGTIGNAR
jgi:hypothetical protein